MKYASLYLSLLSEESRGETKGLRHFGLHFHTFVNDMKTASHNNK